MSSCRKNTTEGTSFVADLRNHIDEFIHASMDEHKTCFKKSMQKLFGMSKAAADLEKSSSALGVESHLPLQTSVSK